jgi:hypothetical protein
MIIIIAKILGYLSLWLVVVGCMLAFFGINNLDPDKPWFPGQRKRNKRRG